MGINPIDEQISRRLRWHAGLADEPPSAAGPSVSSCIDWAGKVDQHIQAAAADFLEALSAFNFELNGPRPSDSTTGSDSVPRDVAYAVAEVVRILRGVAGTGTGPEAATEAAWTIETGWRAILAGDIDDIRQHVAEERRARKT